MHILHFDRYGQIASTKAAPGRTLTTGYAGPHLTHTGYCQSLLKDRQILYRCFNIIWVFFLICDEVKHLFILAVSTSVNCLFVLFTYFSIGLVVLLINL